MRILYCAANFKSDLIEAISLNAVRLADDMSERLGHSVDLLVPGNRPRVLAPASGVNVMTYSVEQDYASKFRIFRNIVALRSELGRRRTDYDVCHFHTGTPLELFLIWLLIPRVRGLIVATVWQPHLSFKELVFLCRAIGVHTPQLLQHIIFNSVFHWPFYWLGQSFFDALIFPTGHQQKIANYASDRKKFVAANGVADISLKKIARKDRPPHFIYIGHATALKGLPTLIKAIEIAKNAGANFRFTIALSDYGQTNELINCLSKKGIQSVVSIKGKVNVSTELMEHDAFVLPILASVGTTSIPNTLLEACAAGRIVIHSALPTLVNFQSALSNPSFPPGNAHALADHICALANDLTRCQKIGSENHRYYLENFTIERFASAYEAIYKQHPNRILKQAGACGK